MEELSLGEIRIRTKFNPSSDDKVYLLKQNTANLIDTLECLKTETGQSEKNRLISIAQTKYEEAAMWAVKAATADK